jgi:hypothetical protein
MQPTQKLTGMNVWTAIIQHVISISVMRASGPREADVRTVEVESAISLTDERASGPRLTDVRTVIYHIVQTVDRSSLYWNLERI